jgi:DNA polymerase-3 subunit gamma/tau
MLTNTLRPKSWAQVHGNTASVKVLRRVLEDGSVRCLLFEGPTGVGKTTLARIAAAEIGCDPRCVIEKNGADDRGIDAWREVQGQLMMRPLYGKFVVVIVDECHALTKEAWDSLLKVMEEPPEHVYFFFCTTKSLGDFPKTIQSRMMPIPLKGLSLAELSDFLDAVCESEDIKLTKKVKKTLTTTADGSVRQILMRLEGVRALETPEEQLEYLGLAAVDDADISSELREFCQALLNGNEQTLLPQALVVLNNLAPAAKNPESIRQIVLAYFTTIGLSAQPGTKNWQRSIQVIASFSIPWPPLTTKLAGVLLSIDTLKQNLAV